MLSTVLNAGDVELKTRNEVPALVEVGRWGSAQNVELVRAVREGRTGRGGSRSGNPGRRRGGGARSGHPRPPRGERRGESGGAGKGCTARSESAADRWPAAASASATLVRARRVGLQRRADRASPAPVEGEPCLTLSLPSRTQAFEDWNKTELDSFLIEITANILKYQDGDGTPLLPKIRDSAGQKGTGKWTAISALEYGVPVTLIGEVLAAPCLRVSRTCVLGGVVPTGPRGRGARPGPVLRECSPRAAFRDLLRAWREATVSGSLVGFESLLCDPLPCGRKRTFLPHPVWSSGRFQWFRGRLAI